MALESDLMRAVFLAHGSRRDCRLIRANVIKARHPGGGFVQSLPAGFPDLVVIAARVGFVELKTGTDESHAQRSWRAMCSDLGAPSVVCRSVEEVSAFIATLVLDSTKI